MGTVRWKRTMRYGSHCITIARAAVRYWSFWNVRPSKLRATYVRNGSCTLLACMSRSNCSLVCGISPSHIVFSASILGSPDMPAEHVSRHRPLPARMPHVDRSRQLSVQMQPAQSGTGNTHFGFHAAGTKRRSLTSTAIAASAIILDGIGTVY